MKADILNIVGVVMGLTGVIASLATMLRKYLAERRFFVRIKANESIKLEIEKKYLETEKIRLETRKLEADTKKIEIETLRKQVELMKELMRLETEKLSEEDSKLIKESLNQKSQKGQDEYLRKLLGEIVDVKKAHSRVGKGESHP